MAGEVVMPIKESKVDCVHHPCAAEALAQAQARNDFLRKETIVNKKPAVAQWVLSYGGRSGYAN